MARGITGNTRFAGGLADYNRETLIPDSHAYSQAVDFRSDPQNLSLLPVAIKESGTIVTDLVKWGEVYNINLNTYFYGNTGNLYSRTLAGSYSFLRTVASSHGNGLVYSAEDDFLYYATDDHIGRYGPLSSTTPTFVDDFFKSQGGVPLNTNSLRLLSASSQYADRADTASLSITGNLAISAQINPTTLPAVGSSMVIASKWNLNGNLRSYMLDIAGVSGYFGDASTSALTISADTTETVIDSACTGTIATNTLSATNAGFAIGQVILIHQTIGTGAGTWQRNTIISYTAGTITLGSALNATYVTGAQVRVVPQYPTVTINTGTTYSAKPWDGTVGGILVFICQGTTTVNGTISGDSVGLRGGAVPSTGINGTGNPGEGKSGGLGGTVFQSGDAGGGGGGNGSPGLNGLGDGSSTNGGGLGGIVSGSADLTNSMLGSGGGSGKSDDSTAGQGGNGGAWIFITSTNFVNNGIVTSNGNNGDAPTNSQGNGGGGSGGSILIKAQTATLGTTITASGGLGGVNSIGSSGGNGGNGRINVDYKKFHDVVTV